MKSQLAPMDRAELLALPVSFDLVTAARALHLGRTKAHELARRGEFPVRVLRLGNRYRVTRADLLRFLGEPDNDTPGASVTPPPGHATAPAGVA